jgi:hypothetical protein
MLVAALGSDDMVVVWFHQILPELECLVALIFVVMVAATQVRRRLTV